MKRKNSQIKRQFSAPVIQNLRILAGQIGEIIPATAFGRSPFCFQTIAKNLHLGRYWSKKGVKKELIFEF